MPVQIVVGPDVAVTVGLAFTVITCVAVVAQPELVPVTVYVLVTVVEQVTVAPVVVLRLVAGDHV